MRRNLMFLLLVAFISCQLGSSQLAYAQDVPPPATVTRFENADQLVDALVDGKKFKVVKCDETDKIAEYQGDMDAIASAHLQYKGYWDVAPSEIPEGRHFLAPLFRKGAIMMTGAKLFGDMLGEPATQRTTFAELKDFPGTPANSSSSSLIFCVNATADGDLVIPWTWVDPDYTFLDLDEDNGPQRTNINQFRITVDSKNRALLNDNRYVQYQTLMAPVNPPTENYDQAYFNATLGVKVYYDDNDVNDRPAGSALEFGQVAFIGTAATVSVKRYQKVKIKIFVLGGALFMKPDGITLSGVKACNKDTKCSPGNSCCGGLCRPVSDKQPCCDGEFCTGGVSVCVKQTVNKETRNTCCLKAARCKVKGKEICCPAGQRCKNNKCDFGLIVYPTPKKW